MGTATETKRKAHFYEITAAGKRQLENGLCGSLGSMCREVLERADEGVGLQAGRLPYKT